MEKRRYDITIAERVSEKEYRIYSVYPNEDNGKLTPVVWTSHHEYNQDTDETLNNFMTNIESKAYIEESYMCLEEVFNQFKGSIKWFNSEEEIENAIALEEIKIGGFAICIQFEDQS